MDFLIKYLKELNSANSEKFIVLAVILGLISGFLPTFNIITLIIIFIVFIFRIPIGLYTASLGLFKIIGYFLDYIFHKTGLLILQTDFLNSFWTSLYNLPLLRWSGFNNSIIMGSFVWGTILTTILYFILIRSITKYRNIIFPILESKSYLKWLLPKETKQGIFRLSGLIVISLFSTIIITFFTFFTDPILKTILEYSLSKTTNKTVTIQKLTTSFINPSIKIYNLEIDKFNIDNIYVKSSWKYLIWKKFNIEELLIKNIYTKDSITKLVSTNQTNTIKTTHQKFNIDINLPNPKKLLANNQLYTTKAINKLKQDYKKLNTIINSINLNIKKQQTNIIDIQNKITQLDNKSKNIKNVDDIKQILQIVKNIKQDINKLDNNINLEKNKLTNIKNKINQDLIEIKNSINKDYTKLSSQYDMLKNKQYLSFANTILKPEISYYITKLNNTYQIIKPYIPKNNDTDKNQYIRAKGIDIKFKDTINYPDFILKNLEINKVTFDDASFNIKITNITDNQKIINKPTKITIISTSKYYNLLKINGDYFFNKLNLNTLVNSLHVQNLYQKDLIIYNPIIDINSKITLDNKIINSISNINIKTSKIELRNNQTINNLLKNIKNLNLNIIVENNNLNIISNIDNKFKKILTKIINKKIDIKKKELKKLLNTKLNNSLKANNLKKSNLLENKLNNQKNYLNKFKKSLANYSKKYLTKNLLKSNSNFMKF